jgi:6-pyruvoyltetrahydropterin/6-carboxytetrahydropterin synthase
MYTTSVKRAFVAQHFLVGGDWGAENTTHSHAYQVEVQLMGASLDRHGFLVDIVDISNALDNLVTYFRDQTLNDLAEFAGLNPSIEHFARIFAELFAARIRVPNLSHLRVQLWENEIAWSAYEMAL